MAPPTAGSATPSPRGSPSPARPTCSASPRRSPGAPAPGGRPMCPRTPSRSTRSAGCSPTPPTTWMSTTAPAGSAPKTVLAHAVHLSEREEARLVETGTRIAHCPGLQPVPRCGRHAPGPSARGRADGRARVGRVGRPGRLDLLGHAGRRLRPDGAALARRRRVRRPGTARLAPAGDARRRARPGPGRGHRLAGGRQGSRPHRDRPGVRGRRCRASRTSTRSAS